MADLPTHRHGKAVAAMFGRIVHWYDGLNTVLSCGMDRIWRKRLVMAALSGCPRTTGRVLDLAAGTMDVALALRRRDSTRTVLALDFCPPMLLAGRRKLHGSNAVAIKPVTADALHLPLPNASVDALTIAFGVRNIILRQAAFVEMLRVLVPGGRACILEFGSGKKRIWGGLYNFYLKRVLPSIGRCISKDNTGKDGNEGGAYGYLAHSISTFPTALELEDELRTSGFVQVRHIPLTSGIVCLHTAEKAL